MVIDLLYPIGGGSVLNDDELRYSLRSVEKHLSNFGKVYIIGKLPSFLKDVIHIPYDDVDRSKETNIYKKVLRACQDETISDQFLFLNDDHFFLQDLDAPTFPYFYKNDLVVTLQRLPHYNLYSKSVLRTAQELQQLGLPTNNFDTHTPIIYDKHKFIEVMTKYDWTNRYGFVVKSLYGNSLKIEGVREPDCKLNYEASKEQIYNVIRDRKVWSIGNKAVCSNLVEVLKELYPNPSRWEI